MVLTCVSFFSFRRLTLFTGLLASIGLFAVPANASDHSLDQALEHRSVHSVDIFYNVTTVGKWLTESDGLLMQDPQTSGLTFMGDDIYSVSDASALNHHVRRLHVIDKNTGVVKEKLGPIEISPHILGASCFADYLNKNPDYEALVAIPNKPNQWIAVTEDGTRGQKIEGDCFNSFTNNNFTRYPALIVKLELINDILMLTGVRALEFSPHDNIDKRSLGQNVENDGIEGLAFTRDSRLLFGIEQDANRSARVFELPYSEDVFGTIDSFIRVNDSGLKFPKHMALNNPINGMDIYYPNAQSQGYLIAGARNNDQLWILDLAKQSPTVIVDLNFYAPSDAKCGKEAIHKIRNTALEGVAVHNSTLYLINDPWKQQYPKNVTCIYDKPKYEGFVPLLFELPINPDWFK
ncbi:MAG: hypothetical protein ACJAVV_000549 [Alphaproteobacteria bacterium]|jgi:hypothetical protein